MNMLDVSYSTELYTYKFLTEYDVHWKYHKMKTLIVIVF